MGMETAGREPGGKWEETDKAITFTPNGEEEVFGGNGNGNGKWRGVPEHKPVEPGVPEYDPGDLVGGTPEEKAEVKEQAKWNRFAKDEPIEGSRE